MTNCASKKAMTPHRMAYRKLEVAKMLGITPRTLDKWESLGCGIPGRFHLGKLVLYDALVLDAWISSQSGRAEVGND